MLTINYSHIYKTILGSLRLIVGACCFVLIITTSSFASSFAVVLKKSQIAKLPGSDTTDKDAELILNCSSHELAQAVSNFLKNRLKVSKLNAYENENLLNDYKDLNNLAFCELDLNDHSVYGCNMDQTVGLSSITKLVLADFIDQYQLENVAINSGYNLCTPSETIPDDSVKAHDQHEQTVCRLSGDGGATLSFNSLKKKCPVQTQSFCYEDDLVMRDLAIPRTVDSEKCYHLYDKLRDNPYSKEILDAYKYCARKTWEHFGIKACSPCPKNNLTTFKNLFTIKDILPELLNKSDSYLSVRVGDIKIDTTLRNKLKNDCAIDTQITKIQTLKDLFMAQTNMKSMNGFTALGVGNNSTCRNILATPLINTCSLEKLPDNQDTLTPSWKKYFNMNSKVLSDQMIAGKTGSAPSSGIINFAGCSYPKNKSIKPRPFAVFYQFMQNSAISTQEDMNSQKNVLYDNQDGLWSFLIQSHSEEELIQKLTEGNARLEKILNDYNAKFSKQ